MREFEIEDSALSRPTDRTRSRKTAEARYRFRVDVDREFAGQMFFHDLRRWCRWQRLDWAMAFYSERPGQGRVPRDFARFYFNDAETAERFIRAAGLELAAMDDGKGNVRWGKVP